MTAKKTPAPKSSPLDYRRGVLHGIQAGAAVAYNFQGGRSWACAEIWQAIATMAADIPAACVAIGDGLTDDELPREFNVELAFKEASRRPAVRGKIGAKK